MASSPDFSLKDALGTAALQENIDPLARWQLSQ
jgi:hypothetical protein